MSPSFSETNSLDHRTTYFHMNIVSFLKLFAVFIAPA